MGRSGCRPNNVRRGFASRSCGGGDRADGSGARASCERLAPPLIPASRGSSRPSAAHPLGGRRGSSHPPLRLGALTACAESCCGSRRYVERRDHPGGGAACRPDKVCRGSASRSCSGGDRANGSGARAPASALRRRSSLLRADRAGLRRLIRWTDGVPPVTRITLGPASQGLLEVLQQVAPVFGADGDSHQAVVDPCLRELGVGELAVGRRGRVTDE